MNLPKDLSSVPSTPIPDKVIEQVLRCLNMRQDCRSVSAWTALDTSYKFAKNNPQKERKYG